MSHSGEHATRRKIIKSISPRGGSYNNKVCAIIRVTHALKQPNCHVLPRDQVISYWKRMGRRKSNNTSTNASNNSTRTRRSRRTGTVTRAASNEQTGPAKRRVTGRSTRNCSDDSASNPPASKRPHLQGLNRNDISKIAKLLMDTVNDVEDTEAVETIVEDAEDETVVQEQQSNIGMQLISRIRHTYT